MSQKLSSRPKKRRAKKEDPYPDLALDRCYLAELPLEVLSNILGHVYSIDLLALYRTSTYFHRTLKDPQQQHIWKTARIRFHHIDIPDPIRISEIRVASLLFDDATCSICKQGLNAPLKSHVYPTRVCTESRCKERFDELYDFPKPEYLTLVCGIIPSRESVVLEPFDFFHVPALSYRRKITLFRKSDLDMVVGDIDAGLGKAELQVKYGCTFEETAAFNRYMTQLENISSRIIHLRNRTDAQTKQFISKKLSVYKEKDMKISNSRQFTIERRRAIRSLRGLAEDDWDTIPPRPPTQNPAKPELTVGQIITKEMDEMVAKSKRRKDISALRNTRGKVRDHWQQMMNTSGISGQAASAVPRWNEFASLPGVNSLLKPNDQDGGLDVEDLNKKDSTLAKMVQSNVDSWNSRTQGHFRKILKVPMPKKNEVPEPGTVPPLDRVTALFECTKCKNVGVGLAQEGTLTFKSAVKHRCPGTSAKNFQWTTELFKPDEYAIQVARHALALSGLAEDKTKRSDMDELGARFLCKLCTGKQSIHLNYCNLIGHVKRHIGQNLQGSFEYLSDPPQLDSDTPSSEGLVEKRRRGNIQGFASHPESKNIFTCRHCEKSMLWNALVSHVKAKHKFSDIRDEDFYPEPKED